MQLLRQPSLHAPHPSRRQASCEGCWHPLPELLPVRQRGSGHGGQRWDSQGKGPGRSWCRWCRWCRKGKREGCGEGGQGKECRQGSGPQRSRPPSLSVGPTSASFRATPCHTEGFGDCCSCLVVPVLFGARTEADWCHALLSNRLQPTWCQVPGSPMKWSLT